MKIYYKLNLLIIFLLVIMTLVITASVNVIMNDALEREMLDKELTIAEYVTEDLANPLLQKDTIEVNQIIDNVMIRNTDIRYVYVVDFDGVVVAHTFSQGFPADMVTANPIPPNENTAVQVFSVEGESIQDVGVRVLDGMDAKVYFGFSRTHLITSINKATNAIISVAALFLSFDIVMSFFLTSSLTSPIEKLVAGTNRVVEGDLDFQVEVTTSDDIGVLTDSFNRMTAERKRIEEALRESGKKYHLLADNTLDCIWQMNLDFEFTYVNLSVYQLFGFTQEEWIGSSLSDHCSPENMGFISNLANEESKKGNESSGVIFETQLLHKNGEIIAVEINAKIIFDNDGNPVSIQGTTRNITERKQVEEKLKASEDKYSTLVEKGNDGIIIIQDFVLKFVNSRMIEFTGFTKDEVIGKPFFDHVSSEYKELIAERVKKRLNGEAIPNKYEIAILSKDGSSIPVEINATLIEYEGRPADMAIIRDITERRQAEAELQKLNEELEQRVTERTAELEDKNDELERMNKLFVGRELRMAELKEQISGLEEKHRGSDSRT